MTDVEILTEYCQGYENVKENTEHCCNIKLMMHARKIIVMKVVGWKQLVQFQYL
jgi:hypothetical protein